MMRKAKSRHNELMKHLYSLPGEEFQQVDLRREIVTFSFDELHNSRVVV